VALCEASTYARWLKAQLEDFEYPQSVGMAMHMDNTAAFHLAGHDGSFQRNKHVLIKRNYTREAIADKVIKVVHRKTDKMPADLLTKPSIAKARMDTFMSSMGMTQLVEPA